MKSAEANEGLTKHKKEYFENDNERPLIGTMSDVEEATKTEVCCDNESTSDYSPDDKGCVVVTTAEEERAAEETPNTEPTWQESLKSKVSDIISSQRRNSRISIAMLQDISESDFAGGEIAENTIGDNTRNRRKKTRSKSLVGLAELPSWENEAKRSVRRGPRASLVGGTMNPTSRHSATKEDPLATQSDHTSTRGVSGSSPRQRNKRYSRSKSDRGRRSLLSHMDQQPSGRHSKRQLTDSRRKYDKSSSACCLNSTADNADVKSRRKSKRGGRAKYGKTSSCGSLLSSLDEPSAGHNQSEHSTRRNFNKKRQTMARSKSEGGFDLDSSDHSGQRHAEREVAARRLSLKESGSDVHENVIQRLKRHSKSRSGNEEVEPAQALSKSTDKRSSIEGAILRLAAGKVPSAARRLTQSRALGGLSGEPCPSNPKLKNALAVLAPSCRPENSDEEIEPSISKLSGVLKGGKGAFERYASERRLVKDASTKIAKTAVETGHDKANKYRDLRSSLQVRESPQKDSPVKQRRTLLLVDLGSDKERAKLQRIQSAKDLQRVVKGINKHLDDAPAHYFGSGAVYQKQTDCSSLESASLHGTRGEAKDKRRLRRAKSEHGLLVSTRLEENSWKMEPAARAG